MNLTIRPDCWLIEYEGLNYGKLFILRIYSSGRFYYSQHGHNEFEDFSYSGTSMAYLNKLIADYNTQS